MTSGKQIVGGFFAAFAAGEMDKALDSLAEDVRWTYHGPDSAIPWAGTFEGRDGVAQFFEVFGSRAETLEMTPQGMWEEDGVVFVRGIEASRVKATGKDYSVGWVHVITTADGRIATFDEYIDSGTVAAACA